MSILQLYKSYITMCIVNTLMLSLACSSIYAVMAVITARIAKAWLVRGRHILGGAQASDCNIYHV